MLHNIYSVAVKTNSAAKRSILCTITTQSKPRVKKHIIRKIIVWYKFLCVDHLQDPVV